MKKKMLVVVTGLALASTGAFAEGLTAPTINTADFYTIAGALLGALATIWVIRRALGLLAR